MLTPFYQHIVQHLLPALTPSGLSAEHFGIVRDGGATPFLLVCGAGFGVKVPAFKKGVNDTRLVTTTERFTLPETEEDRKGPYALRLAPEAITAVTLVTVPQGDAQVSQLSEGDHTLSGNEISLTETHPAGSQLSVSYTYVGREHTDRFVQGFSLKIYEPDPEKAGTYALLSLTAIWAAWETLMGKSYQHVAGPLGITLHTTELNFLGQPHSLEEAVTSQLDFELGGTLTLSQARDGGLNHIETVAFGEERVELDEHGGLVIKH